jgi:hypothetical protein
MKIFCIDSTSSKASIAIVEGNISLYEKSMPGYGDKWDSLMKGDMSILIEDFLSLIESAQQEGVLKWEEIGSICYS